MKYLEHKSHYQGQGGHQHYHEGHQKDQEGCYHDYESHQQGQDGHQNKNEGHQQGQNVCHHEHEGNQQIRMVTTMSMKITQGLSPCHDHQGQDRHQHVHGNHQKGQEDCQYHYEGHQQGQDGYPQKILDINPESFFLKY